MKVTCSRTGYVLDPHGAVAYRALEECLAENETGIFLETAHPAKFRDTVERIIGAEISLPDKLRAFMQGTKQTVKIGADYEELRACLLINVKAEAGSH